MKNTGKERGRNARGGRSAPGAGEWKAAEGMAGKRRGGTEGAGGGRVDREPAKTPGDILRRSFMEPLGLSAYRVAKEIGIPQISLSQILRGRRGISASVAVRLGRYFGVAPQFWLALQGEHDLAKIPEGAEELGVERCGALGDRQFVMQGAEKRAGVAGVSGVPGTVVIRFLKRTR
jgi:antitoxin HigA-1